MGKLIEYALVAGASIYIWKNFVEKEKKPETVLSIGQKAIEKAVEALSEKKKT